VIFTFVMAAALIKPACDWNKPGSDPTISSVPATLRAMGIDNPELAAKIQAGDYSETVTVRRVDDRTWGMSSGNARWCAGEVDRQKWPDDRAEQGRVYRVPGGPAVVWYWHCKNMSFWLPLEAPKTNLLAPPETFELPSEPTSAGTGPRTLDPSGPFDNLEADVFPQIPIPILGSTGSSGGAGCNCAAPPVTSVPESENALLLVSGLVALWLRMHWGCARHLRHGP
jgi:hypothetical protein